MKLQLQQACAVSGQPFMVEEGCSGLPLGGRCRTDLLNDEFGAATPTPPERGARPAGASVACGVGGEGRSAGGLRRQQCVGECVGCTHRRQIMGALTGALAICRRLGAAAALGLIRWEVVWRPLSLDCTGGTRRRGALTREDVANGGQCGLVVLVWRGHGAWYDKGVTHSGMKGKTRRSL